MNEVNVIDGSKLIQFQHYGDFESGFVEILDPLGVNVVVDERNEFDKTRLYMLFKVVDEDLPIVGNLVLPTNIYNTIKRKVPLHVH
jgi:hypothetical protein